eukprot:CAMPEP_0172041932 /NCGR_PEP_ID=MMETSP1041-20130122/25384_1 /TAXON_ID=464988 /ORGANISM="Hemiselmis andersenii, Strain CCMP439" /LENGTH=38 /DNA_ID= /DNA_START= /DNA_END= /DNA_ORIENTATION=
MSGAEYLSFGLKASAFATQSRSAREKRSGRASGFIGAD